MLPRKKHKRKISRLQRMQTIKKTLKSVNRYNRVLYPLPFYKCLKNKKEKRIVPTNPNPTKGYPLQKSTLEKTNTQHPALAK